MFANKKFTTRSMPVFKDSFFILDADNEERGIEDSSHEYIQAIIINDGDIPPKQLISISVYEIPAEKEKAWLRDKLSIDPLGVCSLLPEDAIKFARVLNMLVGEIFNDYNYVHRR
jgi:hypothetical protein